MDLETQKTLTSRILNLFADAPQHRCVPHVPGISDYEDRGTVLDVECSTVFADFGGSTELVDRYDRKFALWLLRSYLLCASSAIRYYGGEVTAFEGDGIMALFTGESKEDMAVRSGFGIQWAVTNLIQPKIDELFPDVGYKMHQVVGIDSSTLSAVRTDVWNHYDILWVGGSANHAANLTRINDAPFSTYITHRIHSKLSPQLMRANDSDLWEPTIGQIVGCEVFRSSAAIIDSNER